MQVAKDKRPLKARLLEYRKQKKQTPAPKQDEQQNHGKATPTASTSTPFTPLKPSTNEPQATTTQPEWTPRTTANTSSWQSTQQSTKSEIISETLALEAPPWRNILDNFFNVDLLDNYPMRKWREFCAERPFQCWLITGFVWAIGQSIAAKAEFGIVFLTLFLILLLLLNLGVREEGKLSAYSVFNPNHERLLGELTGEDFEREVLMRPKKMPTEN